LARSVLSLCHEQCGQLPGPAVLSPGGRATGAAQCSRALVGDRLRRLHRPRERLRHRPAARGRRCAGGCTHREAVADQAPAAGTARPLAPLVFASVVEYLLMIVAALLIAPLGAAHRTVPATVRRRLAPGPVIDVALAAALGVLTLLLAVSVEFVPLPPRIESALAFGVPL